jgi:hypothetical protein
MAEAAMAAHEDAADHTIGEVHTPEEAQHAVIEVLVRVERKEVVQSRVLEIEDTLPGRCAHGLDAMAWYFRWLKLDKISVVRFMRPLNDGSIVDPESNSFVERKGNAPKAFNASKVGKSSRFEYDRSFFSNVNRKSPTHVHSIESLCTISVISLRL